MQVKDNRDANTVGAVVALSDTESFSFLFKALWSSETAKDTKIKLKLLDIILFHEGIPFRWLFTSSKSGEVMKKKSEKLTAVEIVRSIKARAFTLRGEKQLTSKSIVATVWLMESSSVIPKIVTESELIELFLNKQSLNSVLAIQVYLSGWPLRGSGVFEHLVQINQDGARKYQTSEFLNPPDEQSVSTYSRGAQKLIITETHHDVLKGYAKKLIVALEKCSKSIIASIIVQFAFDSTWTPYIVTARNIVLCNAPAEWFQSHAVRSSLIYSSGLCPSSLIPSIAQQIKSKESEERENIRNQTIYVEIKPKEIQIPKTYFSLPMPLLLSNSGKSRSDSMNSRGGIILLDEGEYNSNSDITPQSQHSVPVQLSSTCPQFSFQNNSELNHNMNDVEVVEKNILTVAQSDIKTENTEKTNIENIKNVEIFSLVLDKDKEKEKKLEPELGPNSDLNSVLEISATTDNTQINLNTNFNSNENLNENENKDINADCNLDLNSNMSLSDSMIYEDNTEIFNEINKGFDIINMKLIPEKLTRSLTNEEKHYDYMLNNDIYAIETAALDPRRRISLQQMNIMKGNIILKDSYKPISTQITPDCTDVTYMVSTESSKFRSTAYSLQIKPENWKSNQFYHRESRETRLNRVMPPANTR